MKQIVIFEPAMCCSTGLCGPGIDPELLRVSTVINSLKLQGIEVKRYNLSAQPQEFISNQVINEMLLKEGVDILPIVLVDGVVSRTKGYPTNEEFSQWTGVTIENKAPKIKVSAVYREGKGCC
jgi:hypothetical protein